MNKGTRETTCTGSVRRAERMSLAMVPALILVMLVSWGAASASPSVFFSPGHSMLEPGESVDVSFRVDDCGDSVSGYQLYLSFDPEVVELVSATEGSLYVYSGEPTWFVSEEEGPGQWHFFDTVMGSGTYVLPPGELLHLRFEALDYGDTQLFIDSILLADIDRENLPVEGYEHGYVFVVPSTGVEEGGGIARVGPAFPNPFKTTTAVPFRVSVPGAGTAVEIYDVSGRLVRSLPVEGGVSEGELLWDGRDVDGRELPSSVYFALLRTRAGRARCRLVKTN